MVRKRKSSRKNAAKVSWPLFLLIILGIPAAYIYFRRPAKSMAPLFESSVQVMYVFGDSTVAAGDFLMTPFPYGIDWPKYRFTKNEPTGRFCNGYTVADLLAKYLNIPIPQFYYSQDKKERVLESISLAPVVVFYMLPGLWTGLSATPFWIKSITCSMGRRNGMQMAGRFDEAVSVISVGGNDLMFSLKGKDPRVFARQLGLKMDNLLKTLYEKVGGRKYFVNNVGPLGCIPNKREHSGLEKKCNQQLNLPAVEYNRVLGEVLVMVADSFKLFSLFLESPAVSGFSNATGPCCEKLWEVGGLHGDVCVQWHLPLCSKSERDGYIFFDGVHTIALANQKFVEFCVARKICLVVGKLP